MRGKIKMICMQKTGKRSNTLCFVIHRQQYETKRNDYNIMTVLCVEDGYYTEESFVKNSIGQTYKFKTEKEAIDKLNEWYMPLEIDPQYLIRSADYDYRMVDLVR